MWGSWNQNANAIAGMISYSFFYSFVFLIISYHYQGPTQRQMEMPTAPVGERGTGNGQRDLGVSAQMRRCRHGKGTSRLPCRLNPSVPLDPLDPYPFIPSLDPCITSRPKEACSLLMICLFLRIPCECIN